MSSLWWHRFLGTPRNLLPTAPNRAARRRQRLAQTPAVSKPPAWIEPLEHRVLLATGDLTVAALEYNPGTYFRGSEFPCLVVEQNSGQAQVTAPFHVQVRLSKDQIWGNSDDVIVADFVDDKGLAAGGATREQDKIGRIPDNAGLNTYRVGVKIDSTNAIPESNNDNNIRWSSAADVVVTLPPPEPEIEVRGWLNRDLIDDNYQSVTNVQGGNFGEVGVQGGFITRTFTIRNRGDAPLNLTGDPKIQITGEHAADFTVVAMPLSPVEPNGGRATFQIRFDPSAQGPRRAYVSIASNDSSESSFDFRITGVGVVPDIEVRNGARGPTVASGDDTPTRDERTDFGQGEVNRYSMQTYFNIVNLGDGGLELTGSPVVQISGPAASDFRVTRQPDNWVGPDGANVVFGLAFAPSAIGLREARVTIANSDPDQPAYWFDVQGLGLAPDINVIGSGHVIENHDESPRLEDNTDFGAKDINQGQTTRTFVLQNVGNSNLNLSGRPYVKISGEHAQDFSVVTQPISPVSGGNSAVQFSLGFDPKARGLRKAVVTITSNDPDEGTFSFAIQGTGTGELLPEIEVLGQGSVITRNDTTPSTADGTDFGEMEVNRQSPAREFVIRNIGCANLILGPHQPGVVERVQITGANAGDFILENIPAPTVGPFGGEQKFRIRFRPTGTGLRTARVTINNNDPDEGPFSFDIQGQGLSAGVEVGGTDSPSGDGWGDNQSIGDGDESPSSNDGTDFGTVDINGQSVERTFTLRSTSSVRLRLTGNPPVQIVGEHAGDFKVSRQPGARYLLEGGLTTFKIKFDPSALGERHATVRIPTNVFGDGVYEFDICGIGGQALAKVYDSELSRLIADGDNTPVTADGTDFGSVDVNTSHRIRSFMIRNEGSTKLNLVGSPRVKITGAHASDFTVVEQAASEVEPGQVTPVQIRFDPTDSGLRKATVTILSNDPRTSPYTFDICGTATGTPHPDLRVATSSGWYGIEIVSGDTTPSVEDSTDFGSAAVNSGSVSKSFLLTNLGDAAVRLTGSPRVQITGAAAGDFTVLTSPSGELRRNQSTSMTIRFTPRASGLRQAVVSIASNDPDENPYTFAIQGTGGYPDIEVRRDQYTINNGDTTPRTDDGTDFGPTEFGGQVPSRTFRIVNTGQAALTLTGSPRVQIGGPHAQDFSLISPPPASIAAGAYGDFMIGFAPKAGGVREALITIANSDPDEASYTFLVRGTGLAPQAVVEGNDLVIEAGDTEPRSADGTDFGQVDLETTLTRTFTLRNTGQGPLKLDESWPVVSNNQTFHVIRPAVTRIEAGQSTTFAVEFTATALGVAEATITVRSQDPAHRDYQFAVQGTGVGTPMPEIDVRGNNQSIIDGAATASSTNDTDFGNRAVSGGWVEHYFSIRNTGTGSLSLSGTPRVRIVGEHAADFTVQQDPAAAVDPLTGTTSFRVRFDPSAPGLRLARVEIATNDADESLFDFAIQGAGLVPEMAVSGQNGSQWVQIVDGDASATWNDGTDFGDLAVDQATRDHAFRIENHGDTTLHLTATPRISITGDHAGDFSVITPPYSAIGTSQADWDYNGGCIIRFDPTAPGLRTAVVSIASDDADENPYTFTIQGQGLVPEIDVRGNGQSIASGDSTPDSADHTLFGASVSIGGQFTRVFTIVNSGQAPLRLTGDPRIAINGPAASDFTVVAMPTATLGAASTTTFEVRFSPTAMGNREATMTIQSNDPDEPSYSFAVRGHGASVPDIVVMGGYDFDQAILSGDMVPSALDNTSFGQVGLYNTVKMDFHIRNQGSESLILNGSPRVRLIGASGDFSVTMEPDYTVPPNGMSSFSIAFTPTMPGRRQVTVEIRSNDPDEAVYTFVIEGDAIGGTSPGYP